MREHKNARRFQVHLDLRLRRKIELIAADREQTTPAYLNGLIRPLVERDYARLVRKLGPAQQPGDGGGENAAAAELRQD